LVPKRLGLIASDPWVEKVLPNIDLKELKVKQENRLYDIFVDKLKSLELIFDRPVSSINWKIAIEPVTVDEIIENLKTLHGVPVPKDKLKLGLDIDTIGEHLINASYYDGRFKQEFTFMISIKLWEKKTKATI